MELNQEIDIDTQNTIGTRNYWLVSIDHSTGWPEAKYLRKPKFGIECPNKSCTIHNN